MARTAANPALKASVVKRWVTALALLAFFLQGFAVQTHIHASLQPLAAKTASLPEPTPLKAQDPIDQCRLCQEVAHAGILVAPSASAVAASLIFIGAGFAALPDFTPRSATAFSWQSRAPPHH